MVYYPELLSAALEPCWDSTHGTQQGKKVTADGLNCCSLSENCCEALASALSSTSNHLTELDLSENNLRDSGVMLLSAGLRSQHCKLTVLRLNKCKLRGDCCSALAAALCAESSQLRELDLSANEIQETGIKSLCQELCSHQNKLTTLRLNQCKLMQSCCGDLASLLSSGSAPLKTLDLSHNKLKDSGVSLIVPGLKSLGCRLETLKLSWCGLTDKCCEQLGSALGSDLVHLRELDLSGNNLQGPGFQRLSAGLTSPHCKLSTLRLNECHLQKCCEDVASVLSSESCHLKDINLSGNDLQDAEVKHLSVGLSSLSCKLETLRLSFCSITEEGCTYLASALSSNPHHLRHLDLSYNFLQESGVKLLSSHLDNPTCKLENLSVDHNAECYLKSKLKKYVCRPTLDPNTAGKSLFLHDGGTQVTWVRERQQYPDHPDRFESVSQVLCRQGLTQRHYWEAEWRGRWVDIAVATRGISRRAGYHLCGLGSTERSWSLYCSDGGYSAHHDGEPVEVAAPPSGSRRVGVYLDAPGGTLSFYSVYSGTLRHLHTFHGTFAEPLYPAFGMEEDECSVTICQVEEIVSADQSEKN